MKLIDLEPRWLTPNLFIFKCPHCMQSGWERRQRYLSVKDVPMATHDQWNLFQQKAEELGGGHVIVPTRAETAWLFSTRDFANMSVTPSIDASPSGDWHGHITNGQIV